MNRPPLLAIVVAVAMACTRSESPPQQTRSTGGGGGDAARGRALIEKYACNSCHAIPGIAGPKGNVGPSLDHLAAHPMIARSLPNTPGNLARWMRNPQAIDPDNSMPNLGISESEARDLAAFLGGLK